jgi:anti-sigma B factor antagonist
MAKVKFVDSSGLGALLSCLRQVNAEGGDLKICGLTKQVRVIFELVRMHRIFEMFNTREEAAKAYD